MWWVTLSEAWIFSSAAILAKESPKYFAQWQKNYFGRGIGRGVAGVPMMHTNLFKRYREGNLNMNNPTDRYFKEFMENGGETGWVEQKNLDKWRKEIVKGVEGTRHGREGRPLYHQCHPEKPSRP